MTARGRIERVQNGHLEGWYWDSRNANQPSTLKVFIDQVLIGKTEANLYRDDLLSAGIGTGAHAFRFSIPRTLRDGKVHHFTIVSDPPQRNVPPQVAHLLVEAEPIEGRAERIEGGIVIGWALDPANPAERVRIEVHAGGRMAASSIANRRREDLLRAGIGDGHHGFRVQLPAEILDTGAPLMLDVIVVAGGERRLIGRIPFAPAPAVHAPAPGRNRIDGASAKAGTHAIEKSRVAARIGIAPMSPATSASADTSSAATDAHKKLRELGAFDLFLHTKHRREADLSTVDLSDSGLSVSIPEVETWARLMRPLPGSNELTRSDWLVRMMVEAKAPIDYAGNVLCYEDGAFKLIRRLGRHHLAKGENEIRFVLKAADLGNIPAFQTPDLPVFLAIEFGEPCAVAIAGVAIEAVNADKHPLPYRNSHVRNHVRLAELNDKFSSMARSDRPRWVIETSEVAARLECFITASQLLATLDPSTLDSEYRRRYLNTLAEIALARGEIDELRSMLLAHPENTLADDHLFTAFSLCFPPEADLSSFFSRLPSGRLNRLFLSRARLTGASLSACLESLRQQDEDGQDSLLLASLLRTTAPDEYLRRWNRYLARFGLAPMRAGDVTGDNFLRTLRFDPAPPAEPDDRVSVIISAYNSASTVTYAIESILNQTYPSVELLVCDDRSTDETLDRLLAFRNHPNVRVFRSRDNQGPYNIRNALIEASTGKYITFQDADDVSHPERLRRQVDAIRRSGARAALGKWVRIRPDGEVVFFRDQQCLRMSLVSLMCERAVFTELGGYRNVLCGGDSELFEQLRILGGRNAYVELNMPLIFGLWSSGSLTRQSGLEATEDGYRSPARRDYAERAARLRMFGSELVEEDAVDEANRASGIYRAAHGVIALSGAAMSDERPAA